MDEREKRKFQKRFILRERLRRELLKTVPGSTICLNHEQAKLLTSWIKELERKCNINGFKEC